jgi:hypothetical protein
MSTKTVYRLRVGDLRILYDIDFDRKEVLVFNILTVEQAHKNMSGFSNHQNRYQGLTFLLPAPQAAD